MSYMEKRTLSTILTGAAILAAYCIYAMGKYQAGAFGPEDYRLWAGAMLKFIGLGVAVTVVMQIVFHILLSVGIAVKEKIHDQECDDREIEKSIKREMVEDERDKLIELKSLRVGFIIAGVGFLGALFSLVLGYSPAVMLNVLFIAFSLGSIAEGIARLVLYRMA